MNLKDRLSKGVWIQAVRAAKDIVDTLTIYIQSDEFKKYGLTHVILEAALAKIMDEVITEVLFPTTESGKKLMEAYETVMLSRQGRRAMKEASNDRYFTKKEGGK